MDKIIGIYKIQSTTHPERFYIGSSVDITKRWKCHINLLKSDKHNPKLQNHYNKYGESDIQFSILLECNKDELLEREQFYIDTLKPWFNCCPVAGSSAGRTPWNKGLNKYIDERIMSQTQKYNKKMKGRKTSDETKQKQREASLKNGNIPPSARGLKRTDETKLKMSKSLMGNKCALGNKHSEETKKKMSDARKLYYERKRVRQLENK